VIAAFWALAALFAATALAFVVPALLGRSRAPRASGDEANIAIYRDQLRELDADLAAGTLAREQYDEARRELERRMLEDVNATGHTVAAAKPGRGTAFAVGLAVPLAAAVLYLAVGTPQALLPRPAGGDGQGVTLQQVESMVGRLAAHMKESPDDLKGWVMLGRSYAVLERYPEAAAAYENAVKRSPPDAQLLADYADALAMAQGRTLVGAPEKIIAQALQVDPDNAKALALAGTAAFQKQDFQRAIALWERLLKTVPPGSDLADAIRDSIADARKLAGPKNGPSSAPAPAARAPAGVFGMVSLAPALAARASPGDTVFIFARAAQGSRIPLAVMRKQVRDLPAAFGLDDTMAMSPAAKLSDHAQVVIGARVSKSGNPVAQPGDLEGLTAPVKAGATGIIVVIDREIPAGK
jgi:cytochrome c-type biogenesis protein CcmH